jgi:putative sterol carrier protein
MSATTIFNESIPTRLNDAAEREKMMAVGAVFQFNLMGDEEGSWYIDLKAGACGAGEHDDADCTVTVDSGDFVDLYNGDTQGAALFMQGKIQIEGNMGLALKLDEIMG